MLSPAPTVLTFFTARGDMLNNFFSDQVSVPHSWRNNYNSHFPLLTSSFAVSVVVLFSRRKETYKMHNHHSPVNHNQLMN